MSQVINTNIMSLTTQNNLNKSQSALATAMQRLSSGLRINSSADDAAGFAISTRMTTQINGLDTAARNANDAVSLSQTASAALQQITDNLQAIRQLAVQSANATNSDSDRAALDQEVQQRLAEITRVAQQTTFNGRHILDGSFGTAAFQVGANVGDTISIDLSKGTGASQIGGVATASKDVSSAFGTPAGLTLASGALTVQVGSGTVVNVAAGNYTSASALATAINTAATTAGYGGTLAAVSGNEIQFTNSSSTNAITFGGSAASGLGMSTVATSGTATTTGVNAAVTAPATSSSVTLAAGQFTINGTSIVGTFANSQALADGINSAGIQGVSAYLDNSGNLVVQSNGTASDGTASDGDSIVFGGSSSVATTFGTTAYKDAASLADTGSGSAMDVKTVAGANDAINRVDAALASVSSIDSTLGAMQNRFSSAITSAQAVSQNLSASRSRIQDADFAAETAAMSQAQILQQAGVAMLAQANAQPQLVLKLLP
ncbi:MAG TPA: flagellin [Rhodanobacteraceae bacterium]|nr:flagellin [Rhodanobacteraceae bacterium]